MSPNTTTSNLAARTNRSTTKKKKKSVYFLCISPDAPTNPVLYWLGHCQRGRFLLEEARGPHRLDLGDTLYAPNTYVDPHGRRILWGWLQERRDPNDPPSKVRSSSSSVMLLSTLDPHPLLPSSTTLIS